MGLRRGAGLWGRLQAEATHSAGTVCRNQLIKETTRTHPALMLRAPFSDESWHLAGGSSLGPRMRGFTCSEAGVPGWRVLVPWNWGHSMHSHTYPGAGVIACTGSHALELGPQDARVHMPWSWGHNMHRYTCPGAEVTGYMGSHALELGS